jgi:hypothetical protein
VDSDATGPGPAVESTSRSRVGRLRSLSTARSGTATRASGNPAAGAATGTRRSSETSLVTSGRTARSPRRAGASFGCGISRLSMIQAVSRRRWDRNSRPLASTRTNDRSLDLGRTLSAKPRGPHTHRSATRGHPRVTSEGIKRPRIVPTARPKPLRRSATLRPLYDVTNRRRPPFPTTLSGRDPVSVEAAADLTEAHALRVLNSDAGDDFARDLGFATGTLARRLLCARGSVVLCDVAFELVDGDQPHAPVVEERVQHGDYTAVDRRETHAERLGRLAARVRQSLDVIGWPRVEDDSGLTPCLRRAPSKLSMVPLLLRLPSLPPVRHPGTPYSNRDSYCTCGASVSRLLLGS